ncbi:MAG: glycosyltransferase [Isosphaeraceae bacterium]|nr:glycosyltransferase [Isosphaeraceae bacterium]
MTVTSARREAAGARRVLIVVNDLLVYRAAATQPTGIQRLAEGYTGHLPGVAATLGIEVRTVVVAPDAVRDVTLDTRSSGGRRFARGAELALRISAHAPRSVQERTRTAGRRFLARRARGGGHQLEIGPRDTFLVLGAPWIAPGMAAGAVAAKARSGARLAQLVHDMLPITGAKWYGDTQGIAAAADLTLLLGAADVLAAVSPEVAAEAANVAHSHVTVVLPPDPILATPNDPRGLLPDAPYVLTVGTIHPRKSHVLLLDVWSRWLVADQGAGRVPCLVIVGRRHPQDGPFFERLASEPALRSYVRVVTDASDPELAALYEGCQFLVFPSLAEGWGLPIREALMYGKPSIVTDAIPSSDVSRFIEVVPARDGEAFDRAVRRWWDEPEAVERRIRAIREEFVPRSWDRACLDLLVAILSVDGN